MLAGVLQALRRAGPDVSPVVLSADPAGTARRHRVSACARGPAAAWRALRGAEALVLGGGSLLQDLTSARSAVYYLALLELARLAGARVAWFAQGIGPLRRPLIRRWAGRVARRADLLVVRDEGSRAELAALGVEPARVVLSADAAWLAVAPRSSRRSSAEAGEGPVRLAVLWRAWPGRPVGDEAAGLALGQALAAWSRAAGRAVALEVLAMHPAKDAAACRRLADGCREAGTAGAGDRGRVVVQPGEVPDELPALVERLAGFDGVVSARLHGLVLSAAAGTPFVGIAWEPKLQAFLEEARWPLPALRPQELARAAAWQEAIEALARDGPELADHLARLGQVMRRRAEVGAERLAAWLRQAGQGAEAVAVPAGRVRVLGLPVDRVDLAAAVARLAEQLGPGAPGGRRLRRVVTLNPEMAVQARRHRELAEAVAGAELVVADGIGVVWAARWAGRPLPGRVPGVELAEALMAACARAGGGVYLVGGRPGVAEQAARRLAGRFAGLRVAGTYHGYFADGSAEEEVLLARVEQAAPALLLVGMGSPRQELWLWRHRRRLCRHVGVAVGVGGSLDVWAGHLPRAPALFRRTGTEWLFRMLRQPWRARRLGALVAFALQAAVEGLGVRVR